MKQKKNLDLEERKKQADFLSFTAIVLGVISYILCCVRVVGIVFAVLSLILSIYALVKGGRKALAIAALCIAIIGLGFNFAAISAVTDFLNNLSGDSSNYVY